MLELRNGRFHAVFSPIGARLMAFTYDGVDVVAGNKFDFDLAAADSYAGAIAGRYAGRITKAQFMLDGALVKVAPNKGDFQLHGGPENFAIKEWAVEADNYSIWFTLNSPDGDQGFPGSLDATAIYKLKDNVLSLEIEATTTKPTIINLTNHAYWNMAGKGSVLEQDLQINAASYLPLTEALLPLGEIRKVEGSKFDFRALRKIAEGYDTCFCLDGSRGEMKHGLTLRDPASGRSMEVWTTECAIQMYTAINWNGTVPAKFGTLQPSQAIAIEPQNFPDAPNHANFPSAVLRPGEVYKNKIEWRFS